MQVTALNRRLLDENSLALPLAAVGALLAASLCYTAVPLVVLVGIPLCFYFITRPYELLLFMVFLIPFNFVFTIGPVPVAAELLKVFAWIPFLYCRSLQREPIKTSRYNWFFAVLAGLLVMSVFRSNDLPFTIKEAVRLGSNIGLCYLVVNLVDSREKVFQVFRVLVFSTFLVACYGFYQFAIQDYGALFWIVNPRLDTSLAPGRETFWLWRNRMISVLTSEMEIAHYFNLCLPIGFLLWVTEGRKRLGSQWLWMTVAMLAGLLLSFTFGGWVSLAATTGFFALLFRRRIRWKAVFAAALVLLVVATVLTVGPIRPIVEEKALGSGVGGLAFDAITRLGVWAFAWDTWRSHPWLGVGMGNFQLLQWDYDPIHSDWAPTGSSPHQTYLYLMVQFGLVGLVATLAVMFGSIWSNLRLRGNRELRLAALALAFALIANLVGWFSDDGSFFGPHTSYLVWLLVGVSEAVRNLSLAGSGAVSAISEA